MKRLILIICVLALAGTGTALAQSSSEQGYSGAGGTSRQTPPPNADAGNDDGGGLPFTGADLIVMGGAGAVLLLIGFGLRRLTHHPTETARGSHP